MFNFKDMKVGESIVIASDNIGMEKPRVTQQEFEFNFTVPFPELEHLAPHYTSEEAWEKSNTYEFFDNLSVVEKELDKLIWDLLRRDLSLDSVKVKIYASEPLLQNLRNYKWRIEVTVYLTPDIEHIGSVIFPKLKQYIKNIVDKHIGADT